jgi:hypothetical protein
MNPLLAERLDDYKIMKRAVEAGAVKNGYDVKYNLEEIAHKFRYLDNHIVVEFTVNEGSRYGRHAIRIFDKEEQEKARKFCYNETLEYLRQNCHVKYGEIWSNSCMPVKAENGKTSIVRYCEPLFCNFTKFGRISREEQDRINRKRRERGLALACTQK